MDDASARSLLGNMQARLSRDPYEALGLTGVASHDQVRSAFLQLTKQFHPAKFARLAIDVQRLANEVFLALRGAHDTLAKPSVTPRQATGQLPSFRAPPTRPSSPPQNVATTHAPTQPIPRTQPSGPSAPIRSTPAAASRPPVSPRLAQASAPPAQPTTPATATANRAPIRPGAPSASPTTGRAPTRSTTPPAPAAPSVATAAAAANTDPKLVSIYRLIEKNQFESARMLLEDLVGEKPMPAYKALLHFAKGKEAVVAQRLDEARVEIMEALQIVPDHPLAKSALVELMTRRK